MRRTTSEQALEREALAVLEVIGTCCPGCGCIHFQVTET